MLISPAEPRMLRDLGRTSSRPEQFGADYLYFSEGFGIVGVQRKELSDLVQSHNDDRVSKEIIAMKELDVGIWLIEGTAQWSSDGQSMWTKANYTLSRHLGFLFTLSFQGFSLYCTNTINESGLLLLQLEKWLKKEKHKGISGRPNPRGAFGQPDIDEWRVHFLSGLPGISTDRGRAIVDYYGGLPLSLNGDLSRVPGIGVKTAQRIREIFKEI